MLQIDYGNYLESQTEWALSLDRLAHDADADHARELNEIAAQAHRRVRTVAPRQNR